MPNIARRVAAGAAAGAGATLLMHGMMTASEKLIPNSKPPMRQDAGEFMVNQAKQALPVETRERIPPKLEAAAAKSLQLGYGMTSGALYAALRPRGGSPLIEGALLGIAIWAAGYLGWLPAADLMPPISEQEPRQVIVPIVQHALFGMFVVSGYDAMMRATR